MSLTKDEEKRIEQEEKIREAVRKPKAKELWFWTVTKTFSNSPFGIFVFSSIILASFTSLFSYCQASNKERTENLKVANKYDDEIAKRLQDADDYLNAAEKNIGNNPSNPNEATIPDNLDDPRFINKRVFYYLEGKTFEDSQNIPINPPFYEEFKEFQFYRLTNDLRNYVPDAEKAALLCANEKYWAMKKSFDSEYDFSKERDDAKTKNILVQNLDVNVLNDLKQKEKDAIDRFRAKIAEIRNLRWNKVTVTSCKN